MAERTTPMAAHLPNAVTAVRGAGAVALLATAARRLASPRRGPWPAWVPAGALVCEALDGVDGWAARRLGVASATGAVLVASFAADAPALRRTDA